MVDVNCFDSVWDAIGDSHENAENMKLRAELMDALRRQIDAHGWRQIDAAKHLGVTQPRVSDLMRGRISLFSLDTLINMASAAGMSVEMHLKPIATTA
jgi:predicted XRE-type DNA-binding protein